MVSPAHGWGSVQRGDRGQVPLVGSVRLPFLGFYKVYYYYYDDDDDYYYYKGAGFIGFGVPGLFLRNLAKVMVVKALGSAQEGRIFGISGQLPE